MLHIINCSNRSVNLLLYFPSFFQTTFNFENSYRLKTLLKLKIDAQVHTQLTGVDIFCVCVGSCDVTDVTNSTTIAFVSYIMRNALHFDVSF